MRGNAFFGVGFALVSWVLQPVLAQAGGLAGLPTCAATCFQNALMAQTRCILTDIPCICADEPLNAAIQGCVMTTCTVKQGLVAVNTTSTMCHKPIRSKSDVIFYSAVITLPIAWVATAMRISVALLQNTVGIDDGFALAAVVASTPVSALQTITPGLGFGKDTWYSTPENINKVLQLVYGSQVSYFPASGFTKLCFLFFFLRIFPDKRTQRTIWFFIVFSIFYTIGFTLTMVFCNKPISTYWTSWDGEQGHIPDYAINLNTFYLVAAGFNIGLDLAIVIIPLPELLKLKLSVRKKIFLMMIFSVGAVTIVISCIRLTAIATYAKSTNPMYDNLMSGTYSIIEANVGIICVCMPSFRRFLTILIPNCFNSSQSDSSYKNYEGDGTPNARMSTGKKSRKKSTMNGSLFETNIGNNSVDSRIGGGARRMDSEDEIRLVDMKGDGRAAIRKSAVESEGSLNDGEGGGHSLPVYFHGR